MYLRLTSLERCEWQHMHYCVRVCAFVCAHVIVWSVTVRASKCVENYKCWLWCYTSNLRGQDVCSVCVEIDGFDGECGKYAKLPRLLSTSESTCLIYKPQKDEEFIGAGIYSLAIIQKTISAMKSCDAGVRMNTSGLLLRMKAKKNKQAELGAAP